MITYQQVVDEFNKELEISSEPDRKKFPMYPANHVFDENKSVKWNRDQVIQAANEYYEEKQRIDAYRGSLIRSAETVAIAYIAQELNIDEDKAVIVWDKVWEKNWDRVPLAGICEDMMNEVDYLRSVIES